MFIKLIWGLFSEQLGKKQNGEGKTLICSECNEGFSDERYLHRHIITSHVEMACNYKCQVCNQKFITQNHLNSHTLSHFGVKHIKVSNLQKVQSKQIKSLT